VAFKKESTVASDGRTVAGSLAADFSAGLAGGLAGAFNEGAVCAAVDEKKARTENKAGTRIRTDLVELRMVSFQVEPVHLSLVKYEIYNAERKTV
jgi:hypothetical protein